MKKLVKIVVAIALALSMSITVFASPSSTVDGTVKIIDGVFDDGTPMDDQNYIAAREVQEADKANVDSAVADINTTLKNAGITSAMEVVSTFSVCSVGSVKSAATVTFGVTGLTSGKKASILQYVDGSWKNITTSVGDGTVTGKIVCDGPVIVTMQKTTTPSDKGSSDSGTSGSGSSTSGSSSTSTAATSAAASAGQKGPATGVTFAWPALIAALALAGMSILTITEKKKAR